MASAHAYDLTLLFASDSALRRLQDLGLVRPGVAAPPNEIVAAIVARLPSESLITLYATLRSAAHVLAPRDPSGMRARAALEWFTVANVAPAVLYTETPAGAPMRAVYRALPADKRPFAIDAWTTEEVLLAFRALDRVKSPMFGTTRIRSGMTPSVLSKGHHLYMLERQLGYDHAKFDAVARLLFLSEAYWDVPAPKSDEETLRAFRMRVKLHLIYLLATRHITLLFECLAWFDTYQAILGATYRTDIIKYAAECITYGGRIGGGHGGAPYALTRSHEAVDLGGFFGALRDMSTAVDTDTLIEPGRLALQSSQGGIARWCELALARSPDIALPVLVAWLEELVNRPIDDEDEPGPWVNILPIVIDDPLTEHWIVTHPEHLDRLYGLKVRHGTGRLRVFDLVGTVYPDFITRCFEAVSPESAAALEWFLARGVSRSGATRLDLTAFADIQPVRPFAANHLYFDANEPDHEKERLTHKMIEFLWHAFEEQLGAAPVPARVDAWREQTDRTLADMLGQLFGWLDDHYHRATTSDVAFAKARWARFLLCTGLERSLATVLGYGRGNIAMLDLTDIDDVEPLGERPHDSTSDHAHPYAMLVPRYLHLSIAVILQWPDEYARQYDAADSQRMLLEFVTPTLLELAIRYGNAEAARLIMDWHAETRVPFMVSVPAHIKEALAAGLRNMGLGNAMTLAVVTFLRQHATRNGQSLSPDALVPAAWIKQSPANAAFVDAWKRQG